MKLLITGGSGLVGSNLIKRLELSNEHFLFTPTSRELDLQEYSSIIGYLNKNKPDIIVHCAGLVGGIQANINAPFDFFIKNYEIGKNIVLAAKECNIQKFINLGSSCMYPRMSSGYLKEDMILSGELEPTNEGYALAKISIQRLCSYINQQFPDLSYKTLIPCNLYGEGDKFGESNSHMIPAVIKKIDYAKRKNLPSVEIWGTGKVRREFMFAGDLADCIADVIQNYDNCPDIMNIGIGKDFTIDEYYRTIADVIGFDGKFTYNTEKPEGMLRKVVDISRLTSFGWEAKISLKEGITRTYEFYLNMVKNK